MQVQYNAHKGLLEDSVLRQFSTTSSQHVPVWLIFMLLPYILQGCQRHLFLLDFPIKTVFILCFFFVFCVSHQSQLWYGTDIIRELYFMAITRFIWHIEVWLCGKHLHKNNEAATFPALCSFVQVVTVLQICLSVTNTLPAGTLVQKTSSYQDIVFIMLYMWCGYKIIGFNLFPLPCKLGNGERCVVLACAVPSIHGYNFKVARQTVWQ
jgi:hypothetical protein